MTQRSYLVSNALAEACMQTGAGERSLRIAIFVALLSVVGCASDPAARQEVAQSEAARMQPTLETLDNFTRFELLPISMSDAVAADSDKAAVATTLGTKLEQRVQPLLDTWTSREQSAATERTLVIQPVVASLRVVSGGARFWAGAFSGDSFIDLDLVLKDKDTGVVIATQRVNRNSNAMAGAWSIGKSDKNLLDYIVDIAHEYLSVNYSNTD